MNLLRHLGLALAVMTASGTALADHDHRERSGYDRHDDRYDRHHHDRDDDERSKRRHGRDHYHAPHYSHAYSECKVKRKISHHGRHYKEELYCKAPKHVHVHAHRPPPRHVHVVHVPPPPPAVVIGPRGVKVHGTVSVGW